ncbi:GGDEF domain-containing protein [Clostridium sp.]|uniref:GGDEF domain-containing protein n=2 Tax=Clostridium sp. TaxID=1506 RepID=UPI0032180A11
MNNIRKINDRQGRSLKGISNMNIIEKIKERLSIFNNIYDILRVVNPIDNKVVVIENDLQVAIEGSCYDFWKRNEACKECISFKAYQDNDTAVKFEYTSKSIFLIIATPVEIDGKKYVVEMLKDISKNGVIINKDNHYAETMEKFLDDVREASIRDDLTGVYNRRYIRERLSEDIREALKNSYSMSVIMADIDYFKEINDTYGHLMGDKVLKEFTLIVSKYIRNNTTDWIGRYGGEEFLIVLNDTDEESTQIIAERIRAKIEETIFNFNGNSVNITCSFGVYGWNGSEFNRNELFNMRNKDFCEKKVHELIDIADKKLYEAKNNGRNQVAWGSKK